MPQVFLKQLIVTQLVKIFPVFISVLKIETGCFSEPLINFYHSTWHHIPEDSILKFLNDCHIVMKLSMIFMMLKAITMYGGNEKCIQNSGREI